ncbi:MAG: D-glycero-beta-D-manno-heptose-7-phosphate kinase [Nitrospirota bacterium]
MPHKVIKSDRLIKYLRAFKKARVLVFGDVMVDHFIWGNVSRISPEAPVPVVSVTKETILLGGGANVLNNILALGGKPEICGVIGYDDAGRQFLKELKKMGAAADGIFYEKRPTIVKTRIVAHSQQVVRFDREVKDEISINTQNNIYEFIKKRIRNIDVLAISDYAKGCITENLLADILQLAKKNDVRIVVDPKVKHFNFYQGVTVVTPNNLEASQASGVEIVDEASLHRAGEALLNRLGCDALLITRGEHGMSLFEGNGDITHIPTVAKEVYDVTGAGDTVLATLSLAMAAGAPIKEAAVLANYAAGIVVGIVGTATVSNSELKKVLKSEAAHRT